MSSAHRHTPIDTDTDAPADASSSRRSRVRTQARVDDAPSPVVPVSASPADRSASSASDLATEIERTQLRTRVAALERALRTEQRNRQEIVDQYERILEDRECDHESNNSDSGPERTRRAADSDLDDSSGTPSRSTTASGLESRLRRVLSSVRR